MLINLPIYIGYDPNRSNEAQVLLESLRAYLDSLGTPTENNAKEIQVIADFSLTLVAAILTHTGQLETIRKSDGKGGYYDVYQPVVEPIQTGSGEGLAV